MPLSEKEELQELLDAAREFAHEAGALALRYYGGLVTHEDKKDGTPVTIADREAEILIRERVAEHGDLFAPTATLEQHLPGN